MPGQSALPIIVHVFPLPVCLHTGTDTHERPAEPRQKEDNIKKTASVELRGVTLAFERETVARRPG